MKTFTVVRSLLIVVVLLCASFEAVFAGGSCTGTSIFGKDCEAKAEHCPPNTVPYCMSGWFTPLCECTTEQSRQANALRPLPILTPEILLQSEACIRDLLTSNDPLL